jgi:hypothetical protein
MLVLQGQAHLWLKMRGIEPNRALLIRAVIADQISHLGPGS